MKKIVFIIATLLFAYDAKVDPFDTYKIKSAVSGAVVRVYKNLEAKNITATIVKIDDKQNLIDLKNLQSQVKILKDEIINQQAIVKRKEKTYLTYKKLKTKSKTEKDMKLFDYMNA